MRGAVAVALLAGFSSTSSASLASKPSQLFDSYGDIPWEQEKAHLDNFAIALQQDSNLVGYLIVYAGRCACIDEAKDRALRATRYLTDTRKIQPNQTKWIDGGHRETFTVELQPVPRGAPELTAAPVLKPNEVVTKNCKPKGSKRKRTRAGFPSS